MDWKSVASALADRSSAALLVVDGDLVIRTTNGAMDGALSWPRNALSGRPLLEACVPKHRAAETARLLHDALRGELFAFDLELSTRTGRDVIASVDAQLIGTNGDAALFLTAREIRTREPLQSADLEYEVSVRDGEFGLLRRVAGIGFEIQKAEGLGRCYEVLRHATAPCADCPVRGRRAGTTVVRPREDPPAGFEVLSAVSVVSGTAKVTQRSINDAAFSAMLEMKLVELGERASLTTRELEVLKQLAVGRHADEIADRLEISPRTVKYHQTKLLEKLGADSRHDVLRLIF